MGFVYKRTVNRFVVTTFSTETSIEEQFNAIKFASESCVKIQQELDGMKKEHVTPSYDFFPLILEKKGGPWIEGNVFLIQKLINTSKYRWATFQCLAADLISFKNFIEENSLSINDIPQKKLLRPTYRYRHHLIFLLESGKISSHTAKRKMSTVVSFYRFLINESMIKSEYPPWQEREVSVKVSDRFGSVFQKIKKSTDLSIYNSSIDDPHSLDILDGGRLRPLSFKEQQHLIEVLLELNNIEMLLIHLIALFTGARIQTILTLTTEPFINTNGWGDMDIRIKVGYGTAVDTKKDKQLILFFPRWLCEKIHIYIKSKRYCQRVNKTTDIRTGNLLFVTNRGNAYYITNNTDGIISSSSKVSHNGEVIRQFIIKRVISKMRKKLNNDKFYYKLHDLRASFGMNLTSVQLQMVKKGTISLDESREYVRQRMGHSSSYTTDRYLKYSDRLETNSKFQLEYESYLAKLINGNLT